LMDFLLFRVAVGIPPISASQRMRGRCKWRSLV
jgi:hypothetical protein